MSLRDGILKSLNSGNYTATVQLSSSYNAYPEGITLARSIPAVEMISGRKAELSPFGEHNAKEAAVIAVYT